MIIGLGSVGCYLLDYLVSLGDSQLRLVVVGRNAEKMQMDINIIRTASTIRHQCRSEIKVVDNCHYVEYAGRKHLPELLYPW